MLRTGVAESDGGLCLVVLTADVDDHTLTERWMFDIVTEPQTDQLRIRRRRLPCSLSGDESGLDDPFAVTLGISVVVAIHATIRRRIRPLVSTSFSNKSRWSPTPTISTTTTVSY